MHLVPIYLQYQPGTGVLRQFSEIPKKHLERLNEVWGTTSQRLLPAQSAAMGENENQAARQPHHYIGFLEMIIPLLNYPPGWYWRPSAFAIKR